MPELYRFLIAWYAALSFGAKVALIGSIAIATTAGGLAVIVALPADHFCFPPERDTWWRRHRIARWTLRFVKNVVGIVVLPLGVFMMLPLVPGPGLVFVLLGLSLLDFPGKRALQRKLMARPAVERFLNRLRTTFKKPPFTVDSD